MRKKVAVIGAGGIGTKCILPAIRDLSELTLVGISRRNAELVHAAGETWGCPGFTDNAVMLEETKPELVIIASPSGCHTDDAVLAMEAGADVLIEKPIFVREEDHQRLLTVSARTGRKICGIFQRRLTDGSQAIAEVLKRGHLGKLISITVTVPWNRTAEYYASGGGWRGTWQLDGGGAFMNQGIHFVDQIQYFASLALNDPYPVVGVAASTANLAHPALEVEDSGSALFYLRGGATATFAITTAASPPGDAVVLIQGTQGVLSLVNDQVAQWEFNPAPADPVARPANTEAQGSTSSAPLALGHQNHLRNLRHFLEVIRTGEPNPLDLNGSAAAVLLVLYCYDSAKKGALVKVGS
jgi:UDP-N-acetyl-2-amino-2-deoxyglucuronate dehydrogenase